MFTDPIFSDGFASIKHFGWKPCIKKTRAGPNCKFDQDRCLYEKSSLFWSFLSCETLQFALIPKPLTKIFWHVESHVSMSLPDYIIYTRLPTFPARPAQRSSEGQLISKAIFFVRI